MVKVNRVLVHDVCTIEANSLSCAPRVTRRLCTTPAHESHGCGVLSSVFRRRAGSLRAESVATPHVGRVAFKVTTNLHA